MARIEIPKELLPKLGPEMKMDHHWVDVKLRNGKVFRKLVVRGGRFITGRNNDLGGEGFLPFESSDIAKVRRESIWGWPLW